MPELTSAIKFRYKEQQQKGKTVDVLRTFFVSVEQDALCFEDEDDVLWIRAVQDSGRLCTKELVGFIDFLEHVLRNTCRN